MQGAGNDFIIIDNMDGHLKPDQFSLLAACLCQRRFSLGADGLMVVGRPHADGDFTMHFFNSDGSEGEMCGNGARCICHYGYEHGLCGRTARIETKAGIVTGQRKSDELYTVRLNDPTVIQIDEPVETTQKIYHCSYVELGSPGLPHAVVHLPGLKPWEHAHLRETGRSLRSYQRFPKGANVNFYDIQPDGSVNLLTFERGVEDFTLACGTGTGSTAAVLALKGWIPRENAVFHMMGGTLYVSLTIEKGRAVSGDVIKNIELTGPAVTVAEGDIKYDPFLTPLSAGSNDNAPPENG